MIFRAKRMGLKVKTHDIDYAPKHIRKGASGKPHDILWGMYEMFRFRIYAWRKNFKENDITL
jgi:hypothetical protein